MIIAVGQLKIDLEEQIVYGPYAEDEIPFAEYEEHQRRFDDHDVMAYQIALEAVATSNILDNLDHTRRWVEHLVKVRKPYTYVRH